MTKKKTERMVDINGIIINEPEHYHESLKWARSMVDAMEDDNIDRSDMALICDALAADVRFSLLMLRDRDV